MLKIKEIVNANQTRTVTPELLAWYPNLDYQGINWSASSRLQRHQIIMGQINPFFNCLSEVPSYPKQFEESNGILTFSKFIRNSSVHIRHTQLHQGCQATSENTLVYLTRYGVSGYNLITHAQKLIFSIDDPYTLSYNRKYDLIAGTGHNFEFFIGELNSQTMIHRGLVNGGEHMLNRTLFFDNPTPMLAVGGNLDAVSIWDLGSNKEAYAVPSLAYVNDLDYSESLHSFAFAMDDMAIQIKDDRESSSKPCDIKLEGHLDYNLAVKFLSHHKIASGGQDVSTRIWDLRSPSKELLILAGKNQAVCSLAYKKETDTLFCCENMGHFYGYDLSGDVPKRNEISIFGYPTGLCLTPSKNKLIVPIAEIISGFMEFLV